MSKKSKFEPPAEHLMTIKEVAEYLKLNVCTVYKLVQHGEIPAIKLGGSWRFRHTEIYQWLATKMVTDKKARMAEWQAKHDKLMKEKP